MNWKAILAKINDAVMLVANTHDAQGVGDRAQQAQLDLYASTDKQEPYPEQARGAETNTRKPPTLSP